MRDHVRRHRIWRQTTIDATTGADGKYELSGLTGAEYWVQAYLEGYVFESTKSGFVRAGATVDFRADAVLDVPVDVLLPDGTRPETAWISWDLGDVSDAEAWNSSTRSIRLPAGTYELTARIPGDEDWSCEPATVEVPSSAPPVVLRLRSRTGIRGSVSFAGGLKFSQAQVRALSFTGAEAPDYNTVRTSGKREFAWGGDYSFDDLPSGRYVVAVTLDEGPPLARRIIDVADRIATCDFSDIAVPKNRYIVVRVNGPDGNPAKVTDVSTSYDVEGSSSSGGAVWAQRADGALVVFHHGHDYKSGGKYGIELTSRRYGKHAVQYRKDKTPPELAVAFRAAATLELTLAGFGRSPHSGLVRAALAARDADREEDHPMFDDEQSFSADGKVTIGPVQAGAYDVVLAVASGRFEHLEATRRPLTLRPGANSLTLPMPQLHEVTVIAEDLEPGAPIGLQRVGGGMLSAIRGALDKNRRVRFVNVPAGEYRLLNMGGVLAGSMKITVPGAGTVRFKPQQPNALEVSVEAQGFLAQAGFRTGDVVVGMDGAVFKTTPDLVAAMTSIHMKKEVKMLVDRGGRRIELLVSTRELRDGDLGGTLEPVRR